MRGRGWEVADGVEMLKLARRDYRAEGLVRPALVEPADVLDDRQLELRARAAMSWVVKGSTKLSATALSPTDPTDASTPWSASIWV